MFLLLFVVGVCLFVVAGIVGVAVALSLFGVECWRDCGMLEEL